MTAIQILILIFVSFAASRVILRFRGKELTLPAFLFWVAIWFGLILVTIFPQWASILAKFFGVGRGADLLVYLSVILLFYLIFRIYVRFENLERDLTKLVRQLALREKSNNNKTSSRKGKK